MHTLTRHVYPTDCDMLGHVNHATMITFLEHARWALIEPHTSAKDFLGGGIWSVVRHVDISRLPSNDLTPERLWLQTSEGPHGTRNKLFVIAKRTTVGSATYAAAHPKPHVAICR